MKKFRVFKLSNGWFNNFIRRNKLSNRKGVYKKKEMELTKIQARQETMKILDIKIKEVEIGKPI